MQLVRFGSTNVSVASKMRVMFGANFDSKLDVVVVYDNWANCFMLRGNCQSRRRRIGRVETGCIDTKLAKSRSENAECRSHSSLVGELVLIPVWDRYPLSLESCP